MAVVFTATGITFTPEKAKADVTNFSPSNANTWYNAADGEASPGTASTKWEMRLANTGAKCTTTNANSTEGFAFDHTNSWGSRAFLRTVGFKDTDGNALVQGETYTLSYTITVTRGSLPYKDGYNNPTAFGEKELTGNDLADVIAQPTANIASGNTWSGTATYTPTNNNSQLYLSISMDFTGAFTVTKLTATKQGGVTTTAEPEETTDAQGYWNATADSQWHTVPTNGFKYKLGAAMTGSKYKGGTAFNDPFHIKIGNYAGGDHDFQTRTPVVTVSPGHTYKLTYNIENAGSNASGANIYTTVNNASNDQVLATSSKISLAAGADADIELTFTAPASGEVYFSLFDSWTPVTEFVLTPSIEDITSGWIPTVVKNTAIGNNGIVLFNEWEGNTQYYYGTESSLDTLRVKQTANAQVNPNYYYAEAIRIPNSLAYAGCSDYHKYRITYTFDASVAGGTVRLAQEGYNQTDEETVVAGTNTLSLDFISAAANNTSAYNTEFQFAGATKDVEINNMSYTVTELPQTPKHIYGTPIGGNSLKVTWEPAADIAGEDYDVSLYSGSTATGTPIATATVDHADIEDGHTFTGLTPGNTYTAKVESKLNGETADPITGTYVIDPWIPTTQDDPSGSYVGTHAIGNDGTILYNAYYGNNSYYAGSDSSLANVRVKQNAAAVATYQQEAIRIPNSVIYNSCTPEHKYRLTVSYDASAAGGTLRLHQQGYSQSSDDAVTQGTNTVSIDFVDESAKKTSSIYTELQIAGVAKDTIIDNISYSFTEMPREVNAVYGTVVGGNSLKVDWQPLAGGLPQSYIVNLYSGSSATGTPVDTATVSAAQAAAGYTFTGLTPEGTYTAEVIGTLNGFNSTAITGTYTIDPWIPVSTASTAIGNDGTDIFNEWPGNTHYYTGTLTSLQNVKVKQTADPQGSEYYYAEAIRIPNSVAYGSCVDEHLYKMTVTFDSSAAGGTVVLANGYGNYDTHALVSGTNTYEVEFISDSANNTSAKKTEIQFAGAPKDVVLDNFDYEVTELPRPATAVYGTVVGGNSLKVTWAPAAAGLSQNYTVNLYSGSSATGTPVATATVTPAQVSAGHTFTGLTPEATYTAEVIGTLNGLNSTAVTGTYTIDPWVPTAQDTPGSETDFRSTTAIGNDGTILFDQYFGNNSYYTGTISSLSALKIKQNAVAVADMDYANQERICVPNSVMYASCTNEHNYRMTVSFRASAAGGKVRLYQQGYEQTPDDVTVASGTNTITVDFVSSSAQNVANKTTQLQIAGVAQGTIIDNISYSFTELPRPVQRLYGTSSGGNSLTVTWAPAAAGLSQDYEVTLLNQAGTTVVDGPYTVTAAQASAGYTFTGLTGGTTYTAKVVGVLDGNRSTAVTDTFTVDPWVPTSSANTPVGNDGTYIFNEWPNNTQYYVGTLTSLSNLIVKQAANPQPSTHYYAQAIRIPNSVAYASCVNNHKYRVIASFDASAAGGTAVVWLDGYGQGETKTVVSGTNTFTADIIANSALNINSNFIQIQYAGVNTDTVLDNFTYSVVEVPREVSGVGIGSSIGLTNAGGKYVSTAWDDRAQATGTTYVVSLLDSNDQILYTKTVAGTESSFKFMDGATDDNGATITINPNTTYKTQVVTKIGTATSDPVPSDQSTNTGVWMRMGSAGSYEAEDVLNVSGNARVSSVWGNLYYRYDHTSSLSDLQLKRADTPAQSDPALYYYYKVGQKNSTVFSGVENGARCRLTVSFTANEAASGTMTLQQVLGAEPTYTNHTVTAGANTFSVECDYNSAYANEYTDLLLGGVGPNTEITGITFSVEVLEHWTAGTVGEWVDVGDYGYHIMDDQSGYYSTDTSDPFALKVQWDHWSEYIQRWAPFYVGTNEKTVYPGSVYSYDIDFHRTNPQTSSEVVQNVPLNRVTLHILYDNGVPEFEADGVTPRRDKEITYGTCDANGNISFEGTVPIDEAATSARLYWVVQYPVGGERLSVDPDGNHYEFEEVWRAVDREQAVRDGKYKFIDKDGGAMQYKPSQTSGTGSVDVRVQDGFTDPWVPYLKTNFAEGDYGVDFVEGNEYVATITFDSNKAVTTDGYKGIRFSDYNAGQPNSIALEDNEFEITFVYKDGYDITAGLGWLGESGVELSNFNVAIRDGAPTMPLTNDGTDVVADWTGMEEAAGATKLVYVSKGELVIEDVTNVSSFTFTRYPDNDTEVELYDSYTSTEVHGTKLLRATALADMTILDATVDGIAHANTNNIIHLTIKNIGTGTVVCADDYRQQFIYLVARQGDWKNYKYLCPDPHDGKTPHETVFMEPNQVYDKTTTDARVAPNIDAWRVEEEGTYTINCSINETKIIREKDYTNNNFTFTKDVSTQLADDTAVLGFQLNSNKSSGGPSEYNPSYRTVCRANKQVVVKEGDTAWTDEGTSEEVPLGTYNVKNYGFVYALRDQAGINSKNEDALMSFNGAKQNDYIKTYEAQEEVDIDEWTTKEGSTYNKDNSYFFALTMKDLYYTTDQYETTYTFRSYLQFEAGGKTYTVYPKDVYSTSMYDIAEDLYRYKKMPSEAAHNFLYDNILNIVAMKHNYGKINLAMKDALWWGGEDTEDNFEIVDDLTKDMYYNALCSDPTYKEDADPEHRAMIYKYSDNDPNALPGLDGIDYGEDNYKYTHDHKFRSIRLDRSGNYDSFLATLNKDGVRYYSDTSYDSVYDWIYGEIDHDNGFYKKVEYSWDSNLDKDFGTE